MDDFTTDGKEKLTVTLPMPYKLRLEKALMQYRARILKQVEDYTEDVLPKEELDNLKRRLKQVTSEVMDDMRRIVDDLEKNPTPDHVWIDFSARLGTMENHVLVGGSGTLLHRVQMIEQGTTSHTVGVE